MGDILLDSTRGELEILEFTVNGVYFGINVAKVQEIIVAPKITSTPLAPTLIPFQTLLRASPSKITPCSTTSNWAMVEQRRKWSA